MSAASPAYPISTPVDFTITSGGDGILCNAEGFSTGDTPTENVIVDFVATNPSDILFRQSLGTANTLERLAIGAVGDVLTVGGSVLVAQIQEVDTVADVAGSLGGTYFLLNSPSTGYYVWYDVDGGSTDPGLTPNPDLFMPPGSGHGRTGIEVDISANDTADAVATASRTAIGAFADFSTAGATIVIIITNDNAGIADAAADGTAATAFTFDAPSPVGVSPTVGWAPVSGSTLTTFMAINTASPGTVAAGTTWVTLAAANVTWSSAVFGGHDAGAIFTDATGVLLIPGAGSQIWQLSVAVEFEGNSTGNGGGGIPGRRTVRQVRIFNTTAAASIAEGEMQASSSNQNTSQVRVVAACAAVTAADSIVVQVRHDATSALSMEFEDETSVAAPNMYFTAHQVA